MVTVNRQNNENFDQLLRRFRKEVTKSGVLTQARRKRWYVSDSELRRIARKKAVRRQKRRQRFNR